MSAEQAAELLSLFPAGQYNPIGRTFRIPQPPGDEQAGTAVGRVTIVTAGTSDLPVAEEARETALWTGAAVNYVQDVGVAGPHRLAANLHCWPMPTRSSSSPAWKGRCPASWAGMFPVP